MIFEQQHKMQRQSAKVGWLGAVTAIAQVALPFASSLFGGGNSGVAKGLSGITQFGNQVMQGLNQLESQANQVSLEQASAVIEKANQLEQALHDSTQVYQAKRGKDAQALATFKSKAQAKVSQINRIIQNRLTVPQSRQQTNTVNSILPNNNNLPYYIAGGIGLAVLLRQKK